MYEVKPVGYRVLLEEFPMNPAGNIELPANSTESALFKFIVVAVGDATTLMNGEKAEIPCKVGDQVLYHPKSGISCGPPWMFGGRKLALVEAEGILAVITGDAEIAPPKIERARPKGVLTH